MVKYERWYYRLGLIRASNILSPRVVASSTLFFPINSEVYFFKVTDAPESVSRSIPIFNKPKSVFVISYSSYGTEVTGNFRKLPFSELNYLKQLSTKEKEFRFLKPHEYTTLKIKKNALLIRNFSPVNHWYKYPNNKFVKLWKFLNTFNTVIENINKNGDTERHKFLTIELPHFLPKFEQLNIFARKLTLQRLNSISSYKYFTLLELWKFLDPELKEQSLFNKIKPEYRSKVSLIFTVKGAASVVNLGILENLVAEYYIEPGPGNNSIVNDDFLSFILSLQNKQELIAYDKFSAGNENVRLLGKAKYKSKIFRKMMLLYLNGIINAAELENVPSEDVLEKNEVEIFKEAVKAKEEKQVIEELEKTKDKLKDEDKNSDIIGNISESETEKVLNNMLSSEVPNYNNKTNENELMPGHKEEGKLVPELEDEVVVEEEGDHVTIATVLSEGVDNRQFNTLEQVVNAKLEDPRDKLKKQLSNLKENGVISKKQENDLIEVLNSQEEKLSSLSIDNDSVVDTLKEYTVTDNKVVLDKAFNKKTIEGYDYQYIHNSMKKDTERVLYSLQSAGIIVKDIKVEENDDLLDSNRKYSVEIKPLNGQPSTLTFIIPKVYTAGTFRMSGNEYRMRKQRVERPIRKINPLSVVLSSYYGKLFVNKAIVKAQNYGYFLFNAIRKNESITGLVLGESDFENKKLPLLFTAIGRFVQSFNYENANINFNLKLSNSTESSYSTEGILHVGTIGNDLLYMDSDGMLYSLPKNATNLGLRKPYKHLLDIIGVEKGDGPIEFGSIKIGKTRIPVVILLAYYLGLENLMKILNVKYKLVDSESGRVKYDGEGVAYKIRFRDKTLFIERDFSTADVILGGLLSIKDLQELSFNSVSRKDEFEAVFTTLDYPILQVTEIKLLEDMFVDPMTQSLLRQIKEPETFVGLLIRASELLATDQYPSQGDIEGQVIKGYERINGMLYKTLMNSIKEHECRSSFSRSRINVDPYNVLTKIKDDSTTVLVDDLNPIAETKQKEDVSYLGEGGQQAISMTAERRATDPSVIGIMSEAHKDNSQVGITTYLTPDPSIKNVRGIVKSEDVSNKSWGSILSTPALLAPFATHDDSKRLNFVSIMSAHVVPVNDMIIPYVRTGYESVIPIRVSGKFVIVAREDGVVKEVTDKKIVIAFDSAPKEDVSYSFKQWTTKEEAGVCYTHRLVTALKAKDRFIKDDTILYDELFFQPDIFNRKRVVYKQGTRCRVALCENMEQWEDSGSISKELAKRLSTTLTKVHSIVLTIEDTVTNVTPVGANVEPHDVLFSFMDSNSIGQGKVDSRVAEILKDMKTSSPKAKVKGRVSNIVVHYNCELKDIKSKPLLKLISESDERLMINKGNPGKVNSSYSINGKPLMPNEIEIKYYIEIGEGMSIGDKAILGNQLKFTIGDIYNKVTTVDTNDEIDAFFSYIAICKRITMSPLLLGTTQSLVKTLQEQMIEKYFNRK